MPGKWPVLFLKFVALLLFTGEEKEKEDEETRKRRSSRSSRRRRSRSRRLERRIAGVEVVVLDGRGEGEG